MSHISIKGLVASSRLYIFEVSAFFWFHDCSIKFCRFNPQLYILELKRPKYRVFLFRIILYLERWHPFKGNNQRCISEPLKQLSWTSFAKLINVFDPLTFKSQPHKMVTYTETIRRQIADKLFECV